MNQVATYTQEGTLLNVLRKTQNEYLFVFH